MPQPREAAASDERLMAATERLNELFARADPEQLQLATMRGSTDEIARAFDISTDELLSLVSAIDASAEALAEQFPQLRQEE